VSPAPRTVLIGVGNPYRRDDGVGPAFAASLRAHDLPGVSVLISDGEPSRLLDAWAGAGLAIVVDAVRCEPGIPGRISRRTLHPAPAEGPPPVSQSSTHGLGVAEAVRLAQALDRLPERLVVFAVEAGDIGYGSQLSEAVAASLPDLTRAVLAELEIG
jgi:hydrogenase maturation protease